VATDRTPSEPGELRARGTRSVRESSPPKVGAQTSPTYAAIDLGTNNCRLLIAAPRGRGLRVVDAFSRIVRLGEGLSATGRLSDAAQARTVSALRICAKKMRDRNVRWSRCIATQACRGAANSAAFLARVREETGLAFDIISADEEARLAVQGCASLVDPKAKAALVFDIGGGSTEISWLDLAGAPADGGPAAAIAGWTSLPFGVVNLAEAFGGRETAPETYERMAEVMRERIEASIGDAGLREVFAAGQGHLLGTSGTVTSIAGVYLGLPKYERAKVDGLWMTCADVRAVSERLRASSFDARAAEPCIGPERADLVVAGCAILEAILRIWPSERVRVADRGLREGVLLGLMERERRRRRGGRRRRR